MNPEMYAVLLLPIHSLTIIGFILHGFLHLEPATLALGGATLLMAISGVNPEKALRGESGQ